MKGVIFTFLADMVEEQFGLETWQKILDEAAPEHKGIYIACESYSDEELLQLVGAACKLLDIPADKLVYAYGQHLFGSFTKNYSEFMLAHKALKPFLQSIEEVIHVEVGKLFTSPIKRVFEYEDPAPDKLIMYYSSPRKMCQLAEGLIDGAASYYNTPYQLNHSTCMHKGDERCTLELTFGQS